MGVIISCLLVLVLFVAENSTVIAGAKNGLMLWYQNVIPVLLPFMLLSGIMVSGMETYSSGKNLSGRRIFSCSVIITLFLGVFCGYPIGAKTAADFVKRKNYSAKTGNILMPLCNNSSPMFIAGYIVHTLLRDKISFFTAIFVIYAPYILFVALAAPLSHVIYDTKNKNKRIDNVIKSPTAPRDSDYIYDAVIQITYVGIYIMICSIIIEFIRVIPDISGQSAALLSGVTEITNGTHIISKSNFDDNIKTALILAFTSFGGLSAVLQTNKVIGSLGLSIIFYTVIKGLCAASSFFLYMLLV